MKSSANINIRTTEKLKTSANEVLQGLGMDMSTAINIFLTQVVNKQAIPFMLTAPIKKNKTKIGGWEDKIWLSDDFNEQMDIYGRFKNDPNFNIPVKEVWDE